MSLLLPKFFPLIGGEDEMASSGYVVVPSTCGRFGGLTYFTFSWLTMDFSRFLRKSHFSDVSLIFRSWEEESKQRRWRRANQTHFGKSRGKLWIHQSIMRIVRKRGDGSSSIVVASGMPAIDYGQVDQRRSPIASIIAAVASLRRQQLSVSEKLRIAFVMQ